MVSFSDWYIPVFLTIAIVVLTLFFAIIYYFEPCMGMIGWNATNRKPPASIHELDFKRKKRDDTRTSLIEDLGSQDFDGSRENLTENSILHSNPHLLEMGHINKAMSLDEEPEDDVKEKGTQTPPPNNTELHELNAKNLEKDVATAEVQTTPQHQEYTILKTGSTERRQTSIRQQGSAASSASSLPGETSANGSRDQGEWATISWTTKL